MNLRKAFMCGAIGFACVCSGAHGVDSSENAALRYYRAFLSICGNPSIDEWSDGVTTESLADPDWDPASLGEGFSPESVASDGWWFELIEPAIELEECDFGIRYEEAFHATLPHLEPMGTLAKLVALEARIDLDAGRHEEAVKEIVGILRMARHTIQDEVVISSLSARRIFDLGASLLALATGHHGLTVEELKPVREELDEFDLIDPFGVVAALENECANVDAWIERELRAGRPESITDLLDSLMPQPPHEKVVTVRRAMRRGDLLEEERRLYRQYYHDLIRAWPSHAGPPLVRKISMDMSKGEYGVLAERFAYGYVSLHGKWIDGNLAFVTAWASVRGEEDGEE